MMKNRTALTIQVSSSPAGLGGNARIIAKPNRYSTTRYWVVLPGLEGRAERWLLVATPELGIQKISQWLLDQAERCFVAPSEAQHCGVNTNDHRGPKLPGQFLAAHCLCDQKTTVNSQIK